MSPNRARLRDLDRVRHLVEAADWIADEVENLTLPALLQDRKSQLSLERQFEIIGEAASHISEALQQQWLQISWRQMKGYRNFIAHEYFRPDYTQLLYTAQQMLVPALPELHQLLTQLEQADSSGPDAGV